MASSLELLDMPIGDEGIQGNPEPDVLIPAQEIVTDMLPVETSAEPDLEQIRKEIDSIFEETNQACTDIDLAKRKPPSPFGPGRGTPGPLPGRRPGRRKPSPADTPPRPPGPKPPRRRQKPTGPGPS